ncbi:LOW QUALITY PROTEIN: hypothetical protein QYF61_019724, partial [Mycteria americana]
MKYFPNITTLILIGQGIQKISDLEYCLLLKELWIAECCLVKIDGLQKRVNLQKVYLYCNEISRIENLEALTKLSVLWLNNNLIKNIGLERELAKLQVLGKTSSNKSLRSKNLETEKSVHDNEVEKRHSRFCTWDFRAYSIMGMEINRIFRVHNQILRLKFKKFQIFLGEHMHTSGQSQGEFVSMQPRRWLAFWAASTHCWLMSSFFVHQYPQVLLRRAALDHIIPQPVLKPRIALTQDPALGLVEPHEVHTGPLLQLVQVPLDGILSFWRVSCTTQLGVICKLAEGALDLAVNVIDENIQQRWSQYGPLRDTTPVNCYPLDATIQPIPYPLNSPPIKFVSLQFREEDIMESLSYVCNPELPVKEKQLLQMLEDSSRVWKCIWESNDCKSFPCPRCSSLCSESIYQVNYPEANSVFRPWKCLESDASTSGNEMWASLEQRNCDCSHWHCECFVFDHELALPEYIAEFEYVTLLKKQCLSSTCNIIVEEGNRSTERFILFHDLKHDDEVLMKVEPTVKVRPQIACLNEKKPQYFQWLRPIFSQVQPNQEYFDASHNHVITLEGIRGLSKLQFFDLSWNQLKKSKEVINILHKHTPSLFSFDITHNSWRKPTSLHLRVIGQLKALTNLDGVMISNEEAAKTLQYIAGSKMTQNILGLMKKKLTFSVYFLAPKFCLKFARRSLEKLEHLRWASFSNNNLTQTDGIDSCLNLEELTSDENYISTLDGISKLTKLSRYSVNNNHLNSLKRHPHYISIENNRIISLVGLKKTYSLIKLYISNNFVYTNQERHHLKGFPVANFPEDSRFLALPANFTRHNLLRITNGNLNENIRLRTQELPQIIFEASMQKELLGKPKK